MQFRTCVADIFPLEWSFGLSFGLSSKTDMDSQTPIADAEQRALDTVGRNRTTVSEDVRLPGCLCHV